MEQRRNSWQDGVYGTNCPIPPGQNFTYVLQVKDQIGSFFYFPSLAFHKAAGGYGGIKIASRSVIPVPFSPPADDFTVLAGDWFKQNHTVSFFLCKLCIAGLSFLINAKVKFIFVLLCMLIFLTFVGFKINFGWWE